MSGALAQLWGMINGMQLLVHIACFQIVIPEEAASLLSMLIDVATFDIPLLATPDIFGSDQYPGMAQDDDDDGEVFIGDYEEDKGTLMLLENMGNLGYSSHYMAVIMGSIYVFMFITVLGFMLMPFTTIVRRLHPRIASFDAKLKAFFLWNWCIRLILEAALELSFACMLGMYFIDRITNPGTALAFMDYVLTIVVTICLVALPFFIAIFYNIHWKYVSNHDPVTEEELDEGVADEFEEKYGAVYDGLKRDSRWVLFHSINFILRRVLFAYTCIYLSDHLWL